MILKSEKQVYSKMADKLVAEWTLDTGTQMVTHTKENDVVTKRCFWRDCVRYHLNYRVENAPESLQKLVNEGKIQAYLEDLEIRVVDAVNEQAQKLMDNDKDYQAAVYVGNLNAAGSIGNVLQAKAEEMVYQTIVYV